MSLNTALQEILFTARSGDKSAEEQIFSYLAVRFNVIAKQRINGEDARDVAQDACLVVIEKYKTEDPKNNFESWAYKILRNKIGNYYQHRDITRRSITYGYNDIAGASPASQTVDPVKRRALLDCLKKISRSYIRYARAMNLVQLGYTTEEICERLKVKRSNFYMILNRGRKLLNQCLEKDG
ncbi:MAG: sigma-70 family RNA polymerase sigma factor [candidate division Zixibacteria bacterium]|nr:sigma-70 family RNA polymerase sigma factor [candidate division Zixibacteria bacterium]